MGIKVSEVYSGGFIKAEDLKGKSIVLQIQDVTTTTFEDQRTKEQIKQLVLHFRGTDKQLGLNKTNANAIKAMLMSDDVDDWIGKRVALFPTQVESFGKMVDAVRVRSVEIEAEMRKNPIPIQQPVRSLQQAAADYQDKKATGSDDDGFDPDEDIPF